MQTVENKIDKQLIEKRVSDWKKRIAELYSNINTWLSDSEYALKVGHKLTMYEELMAHYDVPATEIDTKDVYKGKTFILAFKPRGLWIIGANGRIDILTTNGNYILVDSAAPFETPQWKLFNGDRNNGVEFTESTFLKLLK